ncbi:MAG TPA: response regulator [Ramlibacter sp.]|jgi:signal transduction histidine kinase/ActR/RegA family two-component response regulator/HPt (histidine-containing phosphotransfer) domain-containing protein|nr:response regulator [Ramlibacter sp.]
MAPVRSLLRFLLPLLLLAVATLAHAGLDAVAGRLDLTAVPAGAVPLEGQWGFASQEFVDPRWTELPTRGVARVPSHWNDLPGKPPGANGWGSYVLQVNCPRGESLAVEAVGQRTASRLFVNGTEVAAHGRPGPSPQASWAAVHSRIPVTAAFACPLRITLHVSNFDHRAGGFVRPIYAGTVDALERARESRVVYGTALLSAYFLIGLVGLIFHAARRRETVTLVFGLFCLCMGIYTDMIGERVLLRPFGPQVSWFAYMRVEYLSWIASMALFFLTLRGLFPREIGRRAAQAVLGMLALGALTVLAFPPGVYSYLVLPGQGIAVIVATYIAAALVRASERTRVEGRVLVAGLMAILVSLAIDLFLIDSPRPDQKFAPIGFALFLLSPAVVIARRMSHALNAEERSRTLEENARLREDVERISRHDLKTPLNSIMGAARLLQDDTRLSNDQQELVGVLQRAGLRMLEMVNLSMGLFRMETGTYELRPQAVNLREVVARALVDLHSYADACGVTLHLLETDRQPVVVRAEELLCYSIIANLVKNAIEATGSGGRVAVGLRRGEPVVLTVHNPGEVPPDIARRFFDKYVTGGKSGGTGLGTYSARLMAHAQHGDLMMRTGSGGTTLTLTLPSSREAPAAALPQASTERGDMQWLRDMPARDALLVDDDEFTRLVTRRLLPTPPFRVETAPNGAAAMEIMARNRPEYLLIDMEMPVKNGIETVQWLRAVEAAAGGKRCHVVMMSGNDDPVSIQRALDAGVDRFLNKPVSRDLLLDTLRELETQQPGVGVPLRAHPDLRGVGRAPAAAPVPDPQPEGLVHVDAEWKEMFPEFMRLQREAVEGMAQALAGGDRQNLNFLAHRAFGALSAMGMHWAASQSRIVERSALEARPEELEPRIVALRDYLSTVRIEYRDT